MVFGSVMSRASLSWVGVIELLLVLAAFSGVGALVTGWVG